MTWKLPINHEFGVSMSTLYSWEHGVNAPAEKYQGEIVKFIEWNGKL
jgi:DNA-binding transcriptional regulator YiaG